MVGTKRSERDVQAKVARRAVIGKLAELGWSTKAIARDVRQTEQQVRRTIQRVRRKDGIFDKPKSVRRSRITETTKARVESSIRKRTTGSVRKVAAALRVEGTTISKSTVHRILSHSELRFVRPQPGPLLIAEHRRKRLAFARDHVTDKPSEFRKWVFTDECYFSIDTPASGVWISTDEDIPRHGR